MAYKIRYNRNECIGAGECEALSKEFWQLDGENRAILKGSKEIEAGIFELQISNEEFSAQQDVCGSCPVGCITIEKQ